MAMASSTVAAIAAVATAVSAGATVYSSVEAGKARDEQRKKMAEQQQKQDQLLAEEQERVKTEAAQADAVAKNQAQLQARTAGIGGPDRRNLSGRGGTILTSPLGLTGTSGGMSAPKKTILGA